MDKFNFFNLILLQFEYNGRSIYKRYFVNEYERIARTKFINKNRKSPKTTIVVEIVKQLPEVESDDIHHVKSFKGLFTYEYLIMDLKTDSVKIYFKDHTVSKIYVNAVGVYLQAQIIEPVMYLKLLENNVLFMHAAGVAKNNKGYLMPAHGGTGKTTTCIALLNQGFQLLGDDLLLVDNDEGYVFPYPRPLHLFTYNIRNLQGANIPIKYWFIIYFKNVIRFFLEKLLRTDFLISTRVHADELYESDIFAKPVKYDRVLFLTKKGNPKETVKLNKKTIKDVALSIINSADLNDSLYAIVHEKDINGIKNLEVDVVSNLLLKFKSISYINTRKTNFTDASTLAELFD